MGFLLRHWRGELTLPVAFWVNNFLLVFPLGFAVGLMMAWAEAWGQSLQAMALTSLIGLLLLAWLSVWAPVGAWRSANRYVHEGGSETWAGAARFVLGLSLLVNGLAIVFDTLPRLPEQWRMALGRDPIGSLDIRMSEDGHSIVLSGPFGAGAAARFEQVVKDAPGLRRVVLESPGGRLYEADRISTVVRARGLQVRAKADCASACTLVFIAGGQRSLARQARLGFHRASSGSMNPLHDELANHKLAQLYLEAGLPVHFVDGVLRTPASQMWFPPIDVLTTAGILPPPTLQLAMDAGLTADTPLQGYQDVLEENPLWDELERRLPGTIDVAAGRMREARREGRPPDDAVQEAEAVARAAVPMLLRSAGPKAQEAYLVMLTTALRDRDKGSSASCSLESTLEGREMAAPLRQWMHTALAEPADRQPARALSQAEREVLRLELGSGALARVATLAGAEPFSAGRPKERCQRTVELLEAMARLRAPQRRLALRLMLQPPV